MKYVLITGGVVSGLGKGTISSSLGVLLQQRRQEGQQGRQGQSRDCLRVTNIKIDPYLNVDAGTMSPQEHGEVFVLGDGGEVDLDLGAYERFLGTRLSKDHNLTTGKVYKRVLEEERKGKYLGKTVQMVPHVTDTIKEWIARAALIPVDGSKWSPDVCIIELGGTVGDMEGQVFLEALRQLRHEVGTTNFCHVHVSLVPVVVRGGEGQKTKPTQHGYRLLLGAGLVPDMLACRSEQPLMDHVRSKLSSFCQMRAENIFSVHNVPNLYCVPATLMVQGMSQRVLDHFEYGQCVRGGKDWLRSWINVSKMVDNSRLEVVRVGIVHKYSKGSDAYLSVTKALLHACIAHNCRLDLKWIDAESLRDEEDDEKMLSNVDGILVPGGFGIRGAEGKMRAIRWARERQVPFLGICLGFQLAVLEHATNVLGIKNMIHGEFPSLTATRKMDNDDDGKKIEEHPVIVSIETHSQDLGGTMSLGLRKTVLKPNTMSSVIYGFGSRGGCEIRERHRHRYEVNPRFVKLLETKSLMFTGRSVCGRRMTMLEMRDHPFFVATQFHPEFQTSVFRPSPVYTIFIRAIRFVKSKLVN